jgi:hypothetical protein
MNRDVQLSSTRQSREGRVGPGWGGKVSGWQGSSCCQPLSAVSFSHQCRIWCWGSISWGAGSKGFVRPVELLTALLTSLLTAGCSLCKPRCCWVYLGNPGTVCRHNMHGSSSTELVSLSCILAGQAQRCKTLRCLTCKFLVWTFTRSPSIIR